MSWRSLNKLADKVLIIGFVGAIWLPLGYSISKFNRSPSLLIEHYANKEFSFKENLRYAHGWLKVRLMKVSSSPQVVLGNDGWLFFKGRDLIENFLDPPPFSESQLKQWGDILQKRQQWLEKRKIRYLVVIAPDKPTIYGEMLPDYYLPNSQPSRLDQLIAYLRKNTNVEILDLRPSLKEYKKLGKPLYYKTDTHWNELGGAIAANQIQKYLTRWYPQIKPLSLSNFQIKEVLGTGGDLARFLGLEYDYQETHYTLSFPDAGADEHSPQQSTQTPPIFRIKIQQQHQTRSPQKNLPRAVIFRDSFGDYLIPYLESNFSQADWIWTDGFNPEDVEKAKPDLVIQQFVERKLMIIKPNNPASMR